MEVLTHPELAKIRMIGIIGMNNKHSYKHISVKIDLYSKCIIQKKIKI